MKVTARIMKRTLGAAAVVAVGVAFATAGISPSDAQMNELTKQRSDAMKAMGGNMKKVGEAVGAGDSAAAAAAATEINRIASQIPSLFPDGSGTGETRAKPEIWQDFADFRAKANALEAASAKVVADAGAGNLGSDPKAVVGSMGQNCGACHKAYRAPKQ